MKIQHNHDKKCSPRIAVDRVTMITTIFSYNSDQVYFLYAISGVILTLVFMLLGFKLFDKLTLFDTSKQLSDNNSMLQEPCYTSTS